ncbi:Ltp family lipoprotein [Nocardioides sp. cx-173]|uniref:Ltp family lipoprotein n=1 Tax=Nocardioides sp. cx-173 TaxID=2898796 RepID=UPI0022AC3139|nr:Ltp family lipoprotein [Nocardioides sp. cx-173]
MPEDEGTTAADRSEANNKDKKQGAAKGKKSDGPKETTAQENARESAETYLDTSAFSRDGLIKQLKFEGFSQKDAEYGVDAQKANWKKQAAASAQTYLDMSSFSRDGLIQQLKFEGYTQEQAEYGATQVGL